MTDAEQNPRKAQPGTLTPGLRALATSIVSDPSGAPASPGIQTVPGSVYHDENRFARERTALFHHMPVPLLPSVGLSSGQALAHDHYGLPLIVTRDRQGQAHVLLNVCRHRGTRLLNQKAPQTASALSCPYHAWTYALDGTLKGLPRADTFPGLDKSRFGLRRFPVSESGGLIWTRLSGEPFTHKVLPGELVEDFEALGMTSSHVFRSHTHRVDANWKLIMDAFLESYHVQRLHGGTIAPFFADALTASDRVDLHFRSLVARKEFQRFDPSGSVDDLRQVMTPSYSLLPGAVIVASPDYLNVMLLYPQRVDLTLVEDFMLVPTPPQEDDEREHWHESFDLLDGGVFGAEDFQAAQWGQLGLATGHLNELTLGTAEYAVAAFHETLSTLVD